MDIGAVSHQSARVHAGGWSWGPAPAGRAAVQPPRAATIPRRRFTGFSKPSVHTSGSVATPYGQPSSWNESSMARNGLSSSSSSRIDQQSPPIDLGRVRAGDWGNGSALAGPRMTDDFSPP